MGRYDLTSVVSTKAPLVAGLHGARPSSRESVVKGWRDDKFSGGVDEADLPVFRFRRKLARGRLAAGQQIPLGVDGNILSACVNSSQAL